MSERAGEGMWLRQAMSGVEVVVVGGGEVAARKVRRLLEGGARVRVVAPRVGEGVRQLIEEGACEWAQVVYSKEFFGDARYVVAATDEGEVNGRIAQEARASGRWVNVVDGSAPSSFWLPGVVRRGEVEVAVFGGGGAPALTRALVARLGRLLEEERWEVAFARLEGVRSRVKEEVSEGGARARIFRRLAARLAAQVEGRERGEWLDEVARFEEGVSEAICGEDVGE